MKTFSALLLTVPLMVSPLVLAASTEAAAVARPTCDGQRATIVGTDERDRLTGTHGRDVIVGGAGGDRIDGRGGNDVICGGVGGDHIRGGDGQDRLFGELGGVVRGDGGFHGVGDWITPGRGSDFISPGPDDTNNDVDTLDHSGASRRVVVDVPARTVTGQGGDTLSTDFVADVVGSAYDDRMVADAGGGAWFRSGPGDDEFVGGPGNDAFEGGAGDDIFAGGANHDRAYPGPGHDVIDGGEGDDSLDDRDRDVDELYGGPGDDRISMFFVAEPGQVLDGGDGADWAYLDAAGRPGVRPAEATTDLGAGSTALAGGAVAVTRNLEILFGGPARHWTVIGTEGNDEVAVWSEVRLTASMQGGDDRVEGGNQADVLDGGTGHDDLLGDRGPDLLQGGDGDDFFNGDRGEDTIDGGDGVDRGYAGTGEDTCHAVEDLPNADCEHVD